MRFLLYWKDFAALKEENSTEIAKERVLYMTGEEAMERLKPFLRDELKTDIAAEFAEHIAGCKSCKDELEVSYCLKTAIRQLNEEEEFSGDYIKELNNKLLETIKEAKRERKMIYRKRILIFVELLVIGLLIGLHL